MATRVYISSTYADLVTFRDAVYRTLRQMGHDSVAMEDYVATDERPLDKCLRDVSGCDLYIGIIGWRYGYVPSDDNAELKSITQLEYERATALKRPRLLFLVNPSASWPEEYVDQVTGEGSKGARIDRFREELCRRHVVSFFATPDELGKFVSIALHHWQIQTTYVAPAPKLSEVPFPKELRVKNYIPEKSLTLSYRAGLPDKIFSVIFICFVLSFVVWVLYYGDNSCRLPVVVIFCIFLWAFFRPQSITFNVEKLTTRIQGPGYVQWLPPLVGQLKLITREERSGWRARLIYLRFELARTGSYKTRDEARAKLEPFARALNYAMGMHSLKEG